jgi:hypothetical protein
MTKHRHYVYVLLDTESDMKYIGVRSCLGSPNEDPYMGSSYKMTNDDRARCDKLVLEEFDTRNQASQYEVELHERFQVHTNNEYWNLAKQTSTKFISNRKGCTLTEEHKRKCSESLKGRKMKPFSEEHKRNIAKARTGTKLSTETKAKLSEQRQGKANSNFKHSIIYIWEHKDGKIFDGTIADMIESKHVPKDSSHVYKVVNHKRKVVNGWKIIGAVINS